MDIQDPTPFDLIDECVYIIDASSYELLFMNRWARRVFHLEHSEEYMGRKCYEVLQHKSCCCEGCGAEKERSQDSCCWSYFNPLLGRYYQAKDRPMRFRGHEARLEMAVDITNQVQQKHELQAAMETEMALTGAIHILYAPVDFCKAMDEVLRYIGTYLQADRAYVFELHEGGMRNTHEWCREGVPSLMELRNAQTVPLFSNWGATFQMRAVVSVPDVSVLQLEHPEEYVMMLQQGVHSYVEAPLDVNGRIIGFVGVDNPPSDKVKNVSAVLRTLTYFVTASMGTNRSKHLLEQLSYSDAMTGVANRNAFIRDAQEYAEDDQPFGVIYFDLNGLKRVNDELGHKAGDRVIIRLAETIALFFRKTETYRTGGDEFVVICQGISEEAFQRRSEEVVDYIRESTALKVSVGKAWCVHGSDLQAAIADADEAMYGEKKKYYAVHEAHGTAVNAAAALT